MDEEEVVQPVVVLGGGWKLWEEHPERREG